MQESSIKQKEDSRSEVEDYASIKSSEKKEYAL